MAYIGRPFSQHTRFPEKPFDPKAVTRASWTPKPVKPKQDGPLVQFNRHPDAHEVLVGQRRQVQMLSRRTKTAIKAVRVVQLVLRVLQLLGATGVLVLMILISHLPDQTAWVMRITAIVVMVHCVYGIYHMAKPAGARPPASSAAYQVFSAFSDLCVLPMYVYGLMAARSDSDGWSTLLANKAALSSLKTAFYYTLVGAGALHLVTLCVACWLGVKFRQITMMPPDMNPLEDNLTSRTKTALHARNKSSVVTIGSLQSVDLAKEKGFVRPPAVPFAHTRGSSDATSVRTHKSRDSRLDLPSRYHQVMPSNSSVRSSATTLKRASIASGLPSSTIGRGSYAEISLHESYAPHYNSRRSVVTPPGTAPDGNTTTSPNGSTPRQTRFKENWSGADTLSDRTQQRNQALNTLVLNASGKRRDYNPVNQNFDFPESDGEVSDSDTVYQRPIFDDDDYGDTENRYESFRFETTALNRNNTGVSNGNDDDLHPSPLRANPMKRAKGSVTPTVSSMTSAVSSSTSGSAAEAANNNNAVLGELSLNDQRVSVVDAADLGDGTQGKYSNAEDEPDEASIGRALTGNAMPQQLATGKKRWTWAPRNRDSSIQPENGFYSKPYGNLKALTPPIMVGKDVSNVPAGRQVSSGNDYDLGSGVYNEAEGATAVFGRRHVSGKLAEEGRARM
ncbi:hypothetical protein CMQ_1133 [Grosmannia clavigera kw1407]|uniref:Uncharacterized protein n=1 Tax=Grosmannia clavigera (strain kw1407 / UAMH 11150) TaxID=655863 RepID=F0XFU7_GROCL|nr:uncharacterized protein CMQ_1133 [Grosmannia clavigera kw1407]EFX04205.1 hypothetical protein CMQ_1133 [Grosmannia clavigera kw1407]